MEGGRTGRVQKIRNSHNYCNLPLQTLYARVVVGILDEWCERQQKSRPCHFPEYLPQRFPGLVSYSAVVFYSFLWALHVGKWQCM